MTFSAPQSFNWALREQRPPTDGLTTLEELELVVGPDPRGGVFWPACARADAWERNRERLLREHSPERAWASWLYDPCPSAREALAAARRGYLGAYRSPHDFNKRIRSRGPRDDAGCGTLTPLEEFELVSGPDPRGSVFAGHKARQRAWERHRKLLTSGDPPGFRAWGWWTYERVTPIDLLSELAQLRYLAERKLLSRSEVEALSSRPYEPGTAMSSSDWAELIRHGNILFEAGLLDENGLVDAALGRSERMPAQPVQGETAETEYGTGKVSRLIAGGGRRRAEVTVEYDALTIFPEDLPVEFASGAVGFVESVAGSRLMVLIDDGDIPTRPSE
jgi:hypothetical protein